jgi:succinate-semialdehyde dehydrogenase/glutarate-semialdehyde dehydrogenase
MTDSTSQQHSTGQLLIDGEWVNGLGPCVPLIDKYKLKQFSQVTTADASQVIHAIDMAQAAFNAGAPGPYDRGLVLDKAATLMEQRLEDFVLTMQREAGFTQTDATGEVRRCIQTLKLSAEEARRLSGDVIPIAGAPNQQGRIGFTLRVPLGVVVAITPFNSPLNTVTHKVAPAFAAGNAVILKPSTQTPLTACKLAQVLIDAGLPRGFLTVLHGSSQVVQYLQNDSRVRFFAFTGSTEVGRVIQQNAGLRRTQMELGSIACTIVCDDAKLSVALPKIVNAGYRKAGQVCTSVQLLLVHESLLSEVELTLTQLVQSLSFGDPHIPNTFVGPLISEDAAMRVENWIQEAVNAGAKCLVGGQRQGAVIAPTLLTNIQATMKVSCNEIFGPVICIMPFDTLKHAIERVNSTPFGLAAGVFTNRLGDALLAAQSLEVGGVHINETSSSRVDMMPYGGSKDSGFGREGPYYAVHEMTEERVVTFTPV